MTDQTDKALMIAESLVRGEIALSALREISAHVADFDTSKTAYDANYAAQVRNAESVLASRIAATTRRATAALETVGHDDDDDDNDDDD